MFSGRERGSICICARLSIWKTPVVSAARIRSVDLGVVERDPREVDPLAARPGDLVDACARPRRASRARAGRSSGSRRRRRSPCPTGRSAGPPSRPARPGRGRSAAGSRAPSRRGAGRDGGAARRHRHEQLLQAPASAPTRPRSPIASATSLVDSRSPSVGERATRSISPGGQPEDLAEVADRALRAVGGEGRDQGRALGPVALVDRAGSAARGRRGGSRGRCRAPR